MVRKPGGEKANVRKDLSETYGLVKSYLIQETLGPLRHIGRVLAFGVAGATLLGIGLLLLVIAVLRALQEETGNVFAGHWNWVPYLLATVAAMLASGLAGAAALRGRRTRPRKSVGGGTERLD